ncbi:MAG: RNA polymerase-binding protein DksA [Campylobacterales bacterium]|nr:RNA polymerase-binding protein DksA [Campylobacterales bacterium]
MNPKDLKVFQEMLISRKRQIEKNIKTTTKELEELNSLELNDEGDIASISTDNTIDEAITLQQRKELAEIEYALSKISNNTYGVCEMCEEKIGTHRLKVKPHAKYCMVCREIYEKNPKG